RACVSRSNGLSPSDGWASARAGLANKLDAPMAASRSRRFTESSSAWLGGNGAEGSTVLWAYRLQAAGYGLLPSTFSAMTPVLITGCSSGIGAAIAARLARADWPVYATARRLDMLDTLREAGAKTLALDVTNEDSMRNAVAVIARERGVVGALATNAGFGQSGALEEVPIDALRRQFDTNVFGLLRLTQL